MKKLILVLVICGFFISDIICPPVKHQPEEGGTNDEDTGLEYDRYLKEIVTVLEEDPHFRKKLEEANVSDIKTAAVAVHLELAGHRVREKLDEIKRREIDRLKQLQRQKMKTMHGMNGKDSSLHHVDVGNPGSFEVKDLEKLILKATKDLEDIDKRRRSEFKEYEMRKEHEKKENLKHLPEEERKKEEARLETMEKKHADHPKVHHPGSKAQLEEVWENNDHLDPDSFDPKTFFKLHDINNDGVLDENEVEGLFQAELDKVYDPNASEDDMTERYEEMNRMREHVVNELDQNQDRQVSLEEFLEYARKEEFKKDEGWETLDENDAFTDEEFQEYERLLAEQEEAQRNQGAFDSHAQPGVVMHPPQDPNQVQEMNIPARGPQVYVKNPGPGHGMPPANMAHQQQNPQMTGDQEAQLRFHAQQAQVLQQQQQAQQAQLHQQQQQVQQAQIHQQQQAQQAQVNQVKQAVNQGQDAQQQAQQVHQAQQAQHQQLNQGQQVPVQGLPIPQEKQEQKPLVGGQQQPEVKAQQ